MSIRQVIKKISKRIQFALYCMPYGDNDRFVKTVKQIGTENNLINIERFGEGDSEECIYFIDMEESRSGFFADHNRLLAFLYFADCFGMKPVVRYHPNYCYAEKHPVNNTSNPFEYYFKQPSEFSVEETLKLKRVFRSRKENSYFAGALNEDRNGYLRSEEYINEMGRITARYIELNDIVKKEIQVCIQELLGERKTLAVHVRGTDFKRNYNGHPITIKTGEYLEQALLLMKQGKYEQVFLATDTCEATWLFEEAFGEKVVCYREVTRSDGIETVMNSKAERENHHYLLGLEVLRDMYTLAACSGLIAGLSQVSIAARIQKKSYNQEYEDLVILNRGINYHQKENCPNT